MSLPLFLRGLIGVLAGFAAVTYFMTGSVWTTVIQTVICAVLIQVGYFAVVLFLVWRGSSGPKPEAAARDAMPGQPHQPEQATKSARISDRPNTGHR